MMTAKQTEDGYAVVWEKSGKECETFDTLEEAKDYINEYDDDRVLALAEYLEVGPHELEEEYENTYSYGREEYRVLTDAEADDAWDEALDSYLDDCGVLDSIPENLRGYFDREAWKKDARYDGRGHCLSPYDGAENEQGDYYIYRTN